MTTGLSAVVAAAAAAGDETDTHVQAATDRAAAIAQLCAEAGVPAMAAALIRDKASVDDARARITAARDIRAAVTLARQTCPQIEASLADTYIAAGTSLDGVRADLFARIVAAQAATASRSQHDPGRVEDQTTAAGIAASWDEAVAKVNKQFAAARH